MGPFQIPAAITKGKFQGMVCLAALSCSNCFLPCHTDLEHFFFPLFPQRNKLTGDGYAFGTFSKSFGKIKFTVQKIKKPCLIWCNIFISFSIFPTTKFLFIYNPLISCVQYYIPQIRLPIYKYSVDFIALQVQKKYFNSFGMMCFFIYKILMVIFSINVLFLSKNR